MAIQSLTATSQILAYFGLSQNETKLYLALLRHPGSTVQELETRSPFPRTLLYYILNRLVAQGLVSAHKQGGKTRYTPESPDRLYDLLANREHEFQDRAARLKELVPSLKQRYRLAGRRTDVRQFEGIDEYKKALDDMLVSAVSEVLAFGEPDVRGVPGIEVRETSEGRRRAKKITKKVLLFESKEARVFLKTRPYDDYTQYRLVEKNVDPFRVDMQLYDGKILYTTYEDREPMALLIEDELLFKMQKSLFLLLWESAREASLTPFERT